MKVGDIVEVKFIDHATGHRTLEFLLWGRLSKKTKKEWVIQTWAYPDMEDVDDNVVDYAIHPKLILESRVL